MRNLATKNTGDFTITEDGQAFISQRKAAELLGAPRTTLQRFLVGHPNYDSNQGLTPSLLQKSVQHFAEKGNISCIKLLGKLAEAGAKAFIYYQAGVPINAGLQKPPEPSYGHAMLPAWEAERDAHIARVKRQHDIDMRDLQQRSDALDNREYVLIDGMKVKADMHASKVALPVITITKLVRGSGVKPAQANIALHSLGYLDYNVGKGSNWKVSEKGKQYGRNHRSSKDANALEPRWFEGTDLLGKIKKELGVS